jgi:hypothetical protein
VSSDHILFIIALAAMAACDAPEAETTACGGELAETDGVRILMGSEVIGERVRAGRVARCDGTAAVVLDALTRARAQMPRAILARRPTLDVHLDPSTGHEPPILAVETHLETASLLVTGNAADTLDPSVWIHELAHVAAAGPRPSDMLGARLTEAIDEAVADYAASAVLGRTTIGSVEGAGRRDLAQAEPLEPDAFRALALPRHGWEPHRFGLPLAAAFHRQQPEPGPLLTDLLVGLSRPAPWPERAGAAAVIRDLIDRTPESSRSAVADALSDWLPDELMP